MASSPAPPGHHDERHESTSSSADDDEITAAAEASPEQGGGGGGGRGTGGSGSAATEGDQKGKGKVVEGSQEVMVPYLAFDGVCAWFLGSIFGVWGFVLEHFLVSLD